MFSFSDLFFTTAVPSLRCRHPFIRTVVERLGRSVYIGCSRYSRRCRLLGRPLVPSCGGAGARPRAQSPESRLWRSALKLLFELCRYQFSPFAYCRAARKSSVDAAVRLFEVRAASWPDDRRVTLLGRQGAGPRLRLPASDRMAPAKANPHAHNGSATPS